jgi:hypothetical protein
MLTQAAAWGIPKKGGLALKKTTALVLILLHLVSGVPLIPAQDG